MYSCDAKKNCCLTCQYWSAEREIKFISKKPSRVETNVQNTKCPATKSTVVTGSGSNCKGYKRWSDL